MLGVLVFGGAFLVGCGDVTVTENDHASHEVVQGELLPCGCEVDECHCKTEGKAEKCVGDSTACAAEAVVAKNGADFFQPYSVEALAEVRGTQPVALFFHAEWCSTCIKLQKKILATEFPEGALLLIVNFDEETELKKEFGIRKQTSIVLLDADGETFEVVTNPPVETIVSHFQ